MMIIVISGVFGCASGPELAEYPRTQINRPYSLPQGVSSWVIPTVFGVRKNEIGESIVEWPIPFPVFWNDGLAENWQVSYPLPFLITHQFRYNRQGYSGASLGLGVSYSRLSGVGFSPMINFDDREKLTQTFAIDFRIGLNPWFYVKGYPSEWVTEFRVAPLIQFDSFMALTFGPTFRIGELDYTAQENGRVIRKTRFGAVVPLEAKLLWSIHRHWDFNIGYRSSFIGEKDGAFSQLGTIQFTYFW